MAQEPLTAAVRVRLPEEQRAALQEIADDRHLDLSDIIREALRDYVRKQPAKEAQTA